VKRGRGKVAVVSAGNLKTKGLSDIERALQETQEVGISVRGRHSCVVVDVARYDDLSECEIAAAWAQTREEVAAGRYRRDGADAYVARTVDRSG